MIEMTLPFPPTVNTYYSVVRGRKIISKKGREYKADTVKQILAAGHMNAGAKGRLFVTLKLTPPDRRARDIDNYCKALLDAITNAGVWADDSQIKKLHIEMLEADKPGRVDVAISALASVGEPNIQPESAYED